MITLLYLNDDDGIPFITNCPIDKLHKKEKGYTSKCGADWWSVEHITKAKRSENEGMSKTLSSIDFEAIPIPIGHEIIELKFKPVEYTIVADDE